MIFKIGKEKIYFPNRWQEVTLGQILQLRENIDADVLASLSILSGKSVEFWEAVSPQYIEELIVPSLLWTNDIINWDALPLPFWYHIGKPVETYSVRMDSVYAVPEDLDLETYAQKVYIESLLSLEMKDSERIPMVLAAYFEPIYSGQPFSTDRIDEYIPYILNSRCMEALAIYHFFCVRYKGSMRITANALCPFPIRMRLSQVSKS